MLRPQRVPALHFGNEDIASGYGQGGSAVTAVAMLGKGFPSRSAWPARRQGPGELPSQTQHTRDPRQLP